MPSGRRDVTVEVGGGLQLRFSAAGGLDIAQHVLIARQVLHTAVTAVAPARLP